MNLTVNWVAFNPQPSCEYKLSYRKKPYTATTNIIVPSQVTGPPVVLTVPDGNYEGDVYRDCCQSQSTPVKWAVHCWNPLAACVKLYDTDSTYVRGRVAVQIENKRVFPYPVRFQGSFDLTCSSGGPHHITFDFTLAASSTIGVQTHILTTITGGSIPIDNPCLSTTGTITNFTITSAYVWPAGIPQSVCGVYMAIVINGFLPGGGTMYTGSIPNPPAWNGCPTSLPSFTIQYISSGSTSLFIAWLQETDPGSACGNIIFDILDSSSALIVSSTPVPRVGIGLFDSGLITVPSLTSGGVYYVQARYTNGCTACAPVQFSV